MLEQRLRIGGKTVALPSGLREGRHGAETDEVVAQHGPLPLRHQGEGQRPALLRVGKGHVEGGQDPRGSPAVTSTSRCQEETPEAVAGRCSGGEASAAPGWPGDLRPDEQPVGEAVLRSAGPGGHLISPTPLANRELTASTTGTSGAIQPFQQLCGRRCQRPLKEQRNDTPPLPQDHRSYARPASGQQTSCHSHPQTATPWNRPPPETTPDTRCTALPPAIQEREAGPDRLPLVIRATSGFLQFSAPFPAVATAPAAVPVQAVALRRTPSPCRTVSLPSSPAGPARSPPGSARSSSRT